MTILSTERFWVGMYGEEVNGVKNCQLVKLGDFVARRIWTNSYTITKPAA